MGYLPANKTEFSATLAATAGSDPAYNPLARPSCLNVLMKQSNIPFLYVSGNVCIFTLTVSNG